MKFKLMLSIMLLTLLVSTASSQKVIPLYPGKALGSESWNWQEKEMFSDLFKTQVVYNVSQPTLTMYPAAGKPAYEFGYGLSYTNFTYSNLKLSSTAFNNKITATIDITNSGTVAGKEVVQLYISAPSGNLQKPEKELNAFAKTHLLEPGRKQTVSFEINSRDLASYDSKSFSWVASAGKYAVKVGASSQKIKITANFDLAKEIIVEKESNILIPSKEIKEITK